jgi:hypothetical protein
LFGIYAPCPTPNSMGAFPLVLLTLMELVDKRSRKE